MNVLVLVTVVKLVFCVLQCVRSAKDYLAQITLWIMTWVYVAVMRKTEAWRICNQRIIFNVKQVSHAAFVFYNYIVYLMANCLTFNNILLNNINNSLSENQHLCNNLVKSKINKKNTHLDQHVPYSVVISPNYTNFRIFSFVATRIS